MVHLVFLSLVILNDLSTNQSASFCGTHPIGVSLLRWSLIPYKKSVSASDSVLLKPTDMSEFLEDPSVLTKDKLKSALLAHNVVLPNGDQRKDVYVQLYLKNLTAQNKKSSGSPDVFSSDEDLPPAPVISNRSRSGRVGLEKLALFFWLLTCFACKMHQIELMVY